jgi:5'-phosphate synthase pdxT subunit
MSKITIGILALQGAFAEHEKMLSKLNVDCFEIRQKKDLDKKTDGIIIPGGESTVMGKLLNDLDMMRLLRKKINDGLPVFGTCAGLILLAENISGDDKVHLGTMHITAKRNAYGRQLGSFNGNAPVKGIGNFPLTFIRAPYIEKTGDTVDILSTVDGKIVAAREKNQLVTAFHPELTENTGVHKYFVDMILQKVGR